MYSIEQKQLAVNTYYELHSLRKTIRILGYPARRTLESWINEYKTYGRLNDSYSKRKPRYSDAEINNAIDYYLSHGRNITKTSHDLGYPCRTVLSRWLDKNNIHKHRQTLKGTPLLKYSYYDKITAAVELACRDTSAKTVSQRTGVSTSALYAWKRQLIPESEPIHVQKSNSNINELTEQVEDLKKQIHRLQLEKDALESATQLIKKAQGINLQMIANSEKSVVIDALREKYCLKELLQLFNISKSSYFYQHHANQKDDKYKGTRTMIREIFMDSGNTYGYRRIHAAIKKNNIVISEKVIRRLMKEENLEIKKVRIRKYSSYKGEISPAVPNLIQRNFHADKPNQKWLTDITEFHIPAGKVYLSPIIDCFDGLPVSWTIGTSPNAELVNTMLDIAIDQLPADAHPIIHTDRGSHYRWPGWIKRMDDAKLTRSMSRKGCSPDNAACEAFFGRLKTEMFYNHSWVDVPIVEFVNSLDNYIHWYASGRIKMSLGAMSPMEYRRSLGLVS